MMKKNRSHGYGEEWAIAAALLDAPGDEKAVFEHFRVLMRRFGFFFTPLIHEEEKSLTFFRDKLQQLTDRGWVSADAENRLYNLTATGRTEAEKMLKELSESGEKFRALLLPATVSKVTFAVHLVLGMIKLPAALLSGSVSLLNDALDTLTDAVSSVFVYFGIRSGREKLSAAILLFCMLGTGGYALYESVSRFFSGSSVDADLPAFLAVAFSALLSAILWFYQKFAGVRSGSVPIIAQSVDSKNHVLVAAGVGGSLVAARFGLPMVDLLTGLLVALLILKGAAELGIGLIKSGKDEEFDISPYGFKAFERMRSRQLILWLLYEVREKRIPDREVLLSEALLSVDFEKVNQLKALGIEESAASKKAASEAAEAVFREQLVERSPEETGFLVLTEKGEAELNRAFRKHDTHMAVHNEKSLPRYLFSALRAVFIFTILLALTGLVPFLRNTSPWFEPPFLFTLMGCGFGAKHLIFASFGLLLFTAGSLRISAAHIQLRRRHGKIGGTLMKEGIYGRLRHPWYGGNLLKWNALAVASGSYPLLVLALLLSGAQIAGARTEDQHLESRFGERWKEYRSRVNRKFLNPPEWVLLFLYLSSLALITVL